MVGGLLSAHLLSHRAGVELETGWPCTGPLLRLAEKAAIKLLPGDPSSFYTAHTLVGLLLARQIFYAVISSGNALYLVQLSV